MDIRQMINNAEKQQVVRLILDALPEWFGIPESREEYIKESTDKFSSAPEKGIDPSDFYI